MLLCLKLFSSSSCCSKSLRGYKPHAVLSLCYLWLLHILFLSPTLSTHAGLLLFLECGKHPLISRLLHQLFAPPRIIAPRIFTGVCPCVTFSVRSILTSVFNTIICLLSPRHFCSLLSCSTFPFDMGFHFHVYDTWFVYFVYSSCFLF